MASEHLPDYYEILQISPRADSETIDRVFRHLARRYHPDNQDSGDADKFGILVEAHRVLSNPERRAGYDATYESAREGRWRLFDQSAGSNDVVADNRIRLGILSLLYIARRNSVAEPGVGAMEIERLLGVSEQIIRFQTWYLRENGWIERLTTGMWAITATGVDKLFDLGGPGRTGPYLLREGENPHRAAGGE